MSLFEALHILTRIHTTDVWPGHEVFTVSMPGSPNAASTVDYVRAWNQVRHAIGAPSFRDN